MATFLQESLSVVLPCYNEEANIEKSVDDVSRWMSKAGIRGEIIVVDDGSRDGSFALLETLQSTLPQLRVVRHEVNQGYGVAVRSGCDAAACDVIGFMDSDGQFRAKDFELLLPHLAHMDVVTGRRRRRADPFLRAVCGKVLGLCNYVVFGIWVRDVNCGMKVYRRSTWPRIRPEHGVEKLFNTELYLRLRQQNIPWRQIAVPHYPRLAGLQTGASPRVILRMFRELFALRKSMTAETKLVPEVSSLS